jgi:hypothetical protein
MALTDKLTAEKAGLESYLDSERGARLEQSQIWTVNNKIFTPDWEGLKNRALGG